MIQYIADIVGEKQLVELLKNGHQILPDYQLLDDVFGDVTVEKLNSLAAVISHWSQNSNTPEMTEYRLRQKMATHAKSCECEKEQRFPLNDAMGERRREESLLWKRRQRRYQEPLTMCKSMSPLSYIGSGIVVEPMQIVRIVGLKLDPIVSTPFFEQALNEFAISIRSKYGLGKLLVHGRVDRLLQYANFSIVGNNTREISMTADKTITVNFLLDNLMYKSTYYDIDIRDIIEVTFMRFTAQVHVHIRRQIMPDLYDVGTGEKLRDKVTVITKTFERYEAVNRLVDSINRFYPDVNIVVADDSEEPEKITGQNVKQTFMPFAEGLFAGRGVALSQVTTKYFLWVDDDFIFTKQTKLERMVEKLDDFPSNLDLVGGTVNNNSYNKCFTVKPGGQDGDCLWSIHARYRPLERFPQCDVVDVVVDFFMAKTSVVRQIGFDPEYRRIGHTAFFIDGLGKMRVAMCRDVDVDHQPVRTAKYMQYRARLIDKDDPRRHTNHLMFNNNLQCV
uniref:Beta-1,4 N-acetylgalactosaminyltransferase 2-like n=1 Tax=Saccoglossus kowalevskii TaxID=10224 RepID=A0ABM0LWP3_SACKO|nr:PREDICTED: beta-1,4 N-acetylgalactosaminyltransferase 2-like [Saccoglossus kowalevskii]